MYRNYLAFLLFSSLSATSLNAESIVDCRVITGGTTECNPYSRRLIKAKEVTYDVDKQKLIVTKTLPVPAKKPKMKVITVTDMIEKYIRVEAPLRYKGSHDIVIETKQREKVPVAQKVPAEEEKTEEVPEPVRLAEKARQKAEAERNRNQGFYVIVEGDTLSTIAAKYGMKTKELRALNQLEKDTKIRLGKKLLLPFPQDTVDAIATGAYQVQSDDTLISIARRFNLDPKAVAEFNAIKTTAIIRVGSVIQLPLPYRLKALEAKKKAEAAKRKLAKARKRKNAKLIRGFGKHRLRVTATAYTSHGSQTDRTPFLAAWNNHIRPGMKIIAVSRDLLYRYGLRNGSRVRIAGLPGTYRVRDKMNKRFKKRIDIYMGLNRRRALRWGRRSVILYW